MYKMLHNITLQEQKRTILVCGSERIEILCNKFYIEFCPICGDKIK
jgi:hypothetical protein